MRGPGAHWELHTEPAGARMFRRPKFRYLKDGAATFKLHKTREPRRGNTPMFSQSFMRRFTCPVGLCGRVQMCSYLLNIAKKV